MVAAAGMPMREMPRLAGKSRSGMQQDMAN
jgi:hypothetical protein